MNRFALVAILLATAFAPAAEPSKWWNAGVDKSLDAAKANRAEWEKALAAVPKDQRDGLQFLLEHMPEADLKTLKNDFLLENLALGYEAKSKAPWAKKIPEAIFFNNVLPYANVDESRDPWRKELFELAWPMVKDCKTASEAAQTLNKELFPKLKVKYSTQRKAPNASPKASMESGLASCTGLSILLGDACRAVGVPTRVVGTPMWANKRGNHTWLEIWDGDWHFTGACEPDPLGLDRGWFVGDAAQAKKDVPEHAIYAASYAKSDTHFPLAWSNSNLVNAENITDRYAKPKPKSDKATIFVKVLEDKKRLAAEVKIRDGKNDELLYLGLAKGEGADTNDLLAFELPPETEFKIEANGTSTTVTTPKAGESKLVEVKK